LYPDPDGRARPVRERLYRGRSQVDRYFTFLYVRRGNAGVKSIRIHRLAAAGAAAVIAVLLFTSVFMTTRYSAFAVDSKRLSRLEAENRELHDKLDRFGTEVTVIKKDMDVNFELQNRARLMANLDPISKDVWDVGVGGPEPPQVYREKTASDLLFSGFKGDLDEIVRQSRLQKKSYDEILEILSKDVEMRECTPSIRPLKGGFLTSRYGRRMDPFTGRIAFHHGVDYFARTGTPVMATADGVVTMARRNGNFGLMIEVNHGNGFKTKYGHLSRILVKRGHKVKRGEIIGLVGNTGRSTGPHLHYEVMFNRDHRDPLNYVIPDDVYYD
jgi:hypothetical protein